MTRACPRCWSSDRGAVGSFLGGMLAAAGHEVVLLDRRVLGGDDATRLRIEGPDGSQVVPRRAGSPARGRCRRPRVIVLAVKVFHLDGALRDRRPWPDASLLTVSNGVGAEALARAARPRRSGRAPSRRPSSRCRTASRDCTRAAWAWRSSGGGRTRAAPSPTLARGVLVRAPACRSACTRTPRAMKWSKLIGNLVGNATSAIVDGPGRDLRRPARLPQSSGASSTRRSRSSAGGPAAGRRCPAATSAPRLATRPCRCDRPADRVAGHRRRARRQVAVAAADVAEPGAERPRGRVAERGGRERRRTDLGGVAAVNRAWPNSSTKSSADAAAGLVRRPDRPARRGALGVTG